MQTKNTMSITQGRKEIFSIAKDIREKNEYFTLTERGKPAIVLLAAEKFEKMLKKVFRPNKNKNESDFLGSLGAGFVQDRTDGESYRTRRSFQGESVFFDLRELGARGKVLVVCDENQAVYSSRQAIEKLNCSRDLIVAQLYVELIEKYGYPIGSIKIGTYVKIGQGNLGGFIEADVLADGGNSGGNLLFAVSDFENYEKNEKLKVQELFVLAQGLKKTKQKIDFLIYFSRRYSTESLKEKIKVIDAKKFPTFSAWQKAGNPFERKIPKYRR